jgi:hypothetical protein
MSPARRSPGGAAGGSTDATRAAYAHTRIEKRTIVGTSREASMVIAAMVTEIAGPGSGTAGGTIDIVPLVAVAAGLLVLALAFSTEASSARAKPRTERSTGAFLPVGVCEAFADAVARGDMDAAEHHASRAFTLAARSAGRAPVPRDGERT